MLAHIRSGLMLALLAVLIGIGSASLVHAHDSGWHHDHQTCLVCDFEQLLGHGAVQAGVREHSDAAIHEMVARLPQRLLAIQPLTTGIIRAPPLFS